MHYKLKTKSTYHTRKMGLLLKQHCWEHEEDILWFGQRDFKTEAVNDSVTSVRNRLHSCFHLTRLTKGRVSINRYKRIFFSFSTMVLVLMLSAMDEVINVLLLSPEATFSRLFCFHPGSLFVRAENFLRVNRS